VASPISTWDFFSEFFSKAGYKVILHDFKGQGASSKPDIKYTFEHDAENAKKLFDSIGVKKLYVVGYSYGGIVAQRFALKYQHYLDGLVLINTVDTPDVIMKLFDMSFISDLSEEGKLNPSSILSRLIAVSYSNSFLEENYELICKKIEDSASFGKDFFKGLLGLCNAFVNDNFNAEELKVIKVPTLLISSENDRLCPSYYSKRIYDKISHAEYFEIKGSGHAVVAEKPQSVLSLIWGFIDKKT
jgi:3-oxoadipate enol-lactonase